MLRTSPDLRRNFCRLLSFQCFPSAPFSSSAGGLEADSLVWPPPADLISSHPALKRVLDVHLSKEKQQSAALRLKLATEHQTGHKPRPTGSVSNGRLHSAVIDLLRARGIPGTADHPEALTDLRLLDLRPLLAGVGLPTTGNKATVVQRAWQALQHERDSMHGQTPGRSDNGDQLSRAEDEAGPGYYADVFTGQEVAQILVDAKTDDVVILDVRKKDCSFADEMVIATARSKLHCQSAAQAVVYKLKERCKEVAPGKVPAVEGLGMSSHENADWLVVDSGSVVAHVFEAEARERYDIEGLWGDGREFALGMGQRIEVW